MLLVIDSTTNAVLGQLLRRIDMAAGVEAFTFLTRGGSYGFTTSWTAHIEVI